MAPGAGSWSETGRGVLTWVLFRPPNRMVLTLVLTARRGTAAATGLGNDRTGGRLRALRGWHGRWRCCWRCCCRRFREPRSATVRFLEGRPSSRDGPATPRRACYSPRRAARRRRCRAAAQAAPRWPPGMACPIAPTASTRRCAGPTPRPRRCRCWSICTTRARVWRSSTGARRWPRSRAPSCSAPGCAASCFLLRPPGVRHGLEQPASQLLDRPALPRLPDGQPLDQRRHRLRRRHRNAAVSGGHVAPTCVYVGGWGAGGLFAQMYSSAQARGAGSVQPSGTCVAAAAVVSAADPYSHLWSAEDNCQLSPYPNTFVPVWLTGWDCDTVRCDKPQAGCDDRSPPQPARMGRAPVGGRRTPQDGTTRVMAPAQLFRCRFWWWRQRALRDRSYAAGMQRRGSGVEPRAVAGRGAGAHIPDVAGATHQR